MQRTLPRAGLALAVLLGSSAANAATLSFSLNGTLDSGVFNGQSFTGAFSVNDATLTGIGPEWLEVVSLSLDFLGNSYTLADATALSEASFLDGALLGLAYDVSTPALMFTFVPGITDISEAFVAYDTTAGTSGFGSVSFVPISEPGAVALMLIGLGLAALGTFGQARRPA